MHDFEIKVLTLLNDEKESTIEHLEERLNISRDQILWSIESLLSQNAIVVKKENVKGVALSDEGRSDLNGFPEEKLAEKAHKEGKLRIAEIKDQIALSWAKKNGWINIDKGIVSLTSEGNAIAEKKKEYATRLVLAKLNAAAPSQTIAQNKEIVDLLQKRGLIEVRESNVVKSILITKTGSQLLQTAPKETGVGALTRDIITSREWEKSGFRPYNINAPAEQIYPARLHVVREFVNIIRQKWFEMGFIETQGPMIESAFWNFDALFSPQDHPTREMQDTFFLTNPKQLSIEDLEAMNGVKKMHVNGWKEKWSEEIAKGAILRTHTTSVSARYMRKLASALNQDYPLRLFSVGSVFRNENVDYKHLAELHQCDGIIVGDDLTLANLIDTLKTFYGKLGLENIKIRPSYFPFTEPSLETYYYDPEHGDTIELAGGGIIRKEITKALGIDKTVLAWGMGLDRLLLNSRIFGIDSILTLYKNNLGWLRTRGNLKV